MLKKIMCLGLSAVLIVMCVSCTSGVKSNTDAETEQTNSINTETETKTQVQEEIKAE